MVSGPIPSITPDSLAPALSLLGERGGRVLGIATSSSWKGIRCNRRQLVFVKPLGDGGTPSLLPPAAGVSFPRSQCQPPPSLQENHLHDPFLQSEHLTAQRCVVRSFFLGSLPHRSIPSLAHTGSHCRGFSSYCSPELFNAHADKNEHRFAPAWVFFKHVSECIPHSFTTSSLSFNLRCQFFHPGTREAPSLIFSHRMQT